MSTESKAVERTFSDIDSPVEAPHRTDPSQSSLCARCAELRLEEALANVEPPVKDWERLDIKIADVGEYYRHQRANDCDLCHILSASRVEIRRLQDDEGEDELHVYNLCDDLFWVHNLGSGREFRLKNSSLYLAVVPSGFRPPFNCGILTVHGEKNGFAVIDRRDAPKPHIYAPQIVSPLFDLSLARSWLQYCRDHHERLCSLKMKATTELHLIDCRSLEIIPAPDQGIYTALSYVWGTPTTRTGSMEPTILSRSYGRRLPSPMPAVIADAITVTIGLGFHFLWVDRYCIDQESHSKHQQINQMDSIYQNAELTIIAAAGDGPQYGLPGINNRSRGAQRTCTIGNFDIISTMRHPHRTIQSSKWSSRGWTLQEAALSCRNLVFTDDQVYFECNAMNCHESLLNNLDESHVEDKSEFRDFFQAGLFGLSTLYKYGYVNESNVTAADNLSIFMRLVEQYTARDLTYDTDSLKAFTGLIRRFETSKTAVNQIWGVPFCRGESEKETIDSFVDGLRWKHSFIDGKPRRRPGFPSWSWAGWAGKAPYRERGSESGLQPLDSEVESVSIEMDGGSQVKLSTYIDIVKALPQESERPPAIIIQALALPASAFTYDTSRTYPKLKVFGYPANLALSTGPWHHSTFFQSVQNTNQRRCIYLGELDVMVVFMVLEALDGCSWFRVGLITLDDILPWDFRTSWKEFTTKTEVERGMYRSQDIGEEAMSFRVI